MFNLITPSFDDDKMIINLFAYGTLMCPDIFQKVTRLRRTGVRAGLWGYQRSRVRGEVYPGIVPREGGLVEGVVYPNLSDAAWKRLDRFEGDLYQRASVVVHLADGSEVRAQTYVVKPEIEERLTTAAWSLDEFLRTGKQCFESEYFGKRPGDTK